MPGHNFTPLSGRMERFSVDSELLQNRLGDPTLREILVHIPQQADSAMENGELIPVIIYLAPFTSSGPQRAGWKAFAETLPQRHERLISEGKIGVAVGVTEKLIEKFDAVVLVKEAAEILGGKGGGGRKDFAQAGGVNEDKIQEVFKILSKKIN